LKAKPYTFTAKAIGLELKARAIKIGPEAKACPRGLDHWIMIIK